MKKCITIVLAAALMVSFAACGVKIKLNTNTNDNQAAESALNDVVNEIQKQDNEGAWDDLVNEIKQNAEEAGGEMGYVGDEAAGLAGVNLDNYAQVSKEIFGLDTTGENGVTVSKVESYNGVNDLHIYYDIPAGTDAKALLQVFFDRCLTVSPEGVFQQDIDYDTFVIKRGTAYTQFEEFYEAEAFPMENFLSAMWIYDNGSHGVQAAFTLEDEKADISLVLLN